jgi:hypothetical protein
MGLLADFQESTTNLVDEASQVPAQVKARGAVLVRSMLDRFLPAPHDPDELDEIAGRLYPLGVAYLQMGIPELVAAMEGGQFVDGPEIGHELAPSIRPSRKRSALLTPPARSAPAFCRPAPRLFEA